MGSSQMKLSSTLLWEVREVKCAQCGFLWMARVTWPDSSASVTVRVMCHSASTCIQWPFSCFLSSVGLCECFRSGHRMMRRSSCLLQPQSPNGGDSALPCRKDRTADTQRQSLYRVCVCVCECVPLSLPRHNLHHKLCSEPEQVACTWDKKEEEEKEKEKKKVINCLPIKVGDLGLWPPWLCERNPSQCTYDCLHAYGKPQRWAVSTSSTSALSNKAHGRALTLCMTTIHRLPLTNPQSPSYTSSVKRRHADFINPPSPLFPSVLSAATSEISVQTDSSLFLRHQGVVLSCLAHGCILNVKKPEILVCGIQSRQLTVRKPASLHTIPP
ncbi:hypothetical protein F2P79_009530 [Pimephales promelas]|nr:hypothetical protein F2P79_009530 [Pimephales promelas]